MPISLYSRNIKTTLRGKLLRSFDEECVEQEQGDAGTLRHIVAQYLENKRKRQRRKRLRALEALR